VSPKKRHNRPIFAAFTLLGLLSPPFGGAASPLRKSIFKIPSFQDTHAKSAQCKEASRNIHAFGVINKKALLDHNAILLYIRRVKWLKILLFYKKSFKKTLDKPENNL
jgi:hypothetical protein